MLIWAEMGRLYSFFTCILECALFTTRVSYIATYGLLHSDLPFGHVVPLVLKGYLGVLQYPAMHACEQSVASKVIYSEILLIDSDFWHFYATGSYEVAIISRKTTIEKLEAVSSHFG